MPTLPRTNVPSISLEQVEDGYKFAVQESFVPHKHYTIYVHLSNTCNYACYEDN